MYIVPRWRGPDVQSKEKLERGKKLNRLVAAQECDARDDDSSNAVD